MLKHFFFYKSGLLLTYYNLCEWKHGAMKDRSQI